jgi:hypothetical protein
MYRALGCLAVVATVVFFSGCALLQPGGSELLYRETFSNTEDNDWPLQETDTVRKWFSGGKYQFEVHENSHAASKCSAAGEYDDFQLDVDAEHISGTDNKSATGLIFRFVDWDNYYEFLVSPAGSFKLRKQVEGVWEDIVGWTNNAAVTTGVGTNHLTVVAQAGSIVCLVDGEEVLDETDSSFSSGQIGVVGLSYSGNVVMRVAFDNIEVHSLE